MQAHPRNNTGRMGRLQHLPVMFYGGIVAPSFLWFDASPLNGEPVMTQAKRGIRAEIVGVAGCESVAAIR